MPSNKNAVTRYKYLDELLSDRHHYYDIHDLTEKCNEKLVDAGFDIGHSQSAIVPVMIYNEPVLFEIYQRNETKPPKSPYLLEKL